MAAGRIHVGIGGWDYDPWRGPFYPPGLPKSKQLEHASRRVTAIEINATFYKLQNAELYARWAAAVPQGFKFALKGSRFCTNRKVLGTAAEAVGKFCGQGLAALGEKLGPICWQFAETKKFEPDDVEAFFALLPRALGGTVLRHAVEAKNESFRDPRFAALARAAGVAIVFGDDLLGDDPTADFVYCRLKGMREEESEGYPLAALDRIAEHSLGWSASGLEAFLFMIDGAKVRAPAAAEAVLARLGRNK